MNQFVILKKNGNTSIKLSIPIFFYLLFSFFLLINAKQITHAVSNPDTLLRNRFSYNLFLETIKTDTTIVLFSPDSESTIVFKKEADSLGFFNIYSEKLGRDSLLIKTGKRFYIDTLSIYSPILISKDSIGIFFTPQLYNSSVLNLYIQKILSFCTNNGYPFTRIITNILPKKTTNQCTVTLTVEPGNKSIFGSPQFTGNFSIKKSILIRDVQYTPGSLYQKNKIENSLDLLRSRSYINQATALQPELKNKDSLNRDSFDTIAVKIQITEKKGFDIEGGIGLTSQTSIPWIGSIRIQLLNIVHNGEQFSISYKGDNQFQQAETSLDLPFILGTFFTLYMNAGMEINKNSYGYVHGSANFLLPIQHALETGGGVTLHEITTDSTDATLTYYGLSSIIRKKEKPNVAGSFDNSFEILTGTGLAKKTLKTTTRLNIQFSLGTHYPIIKKYAYSGKLFYGIIVTRENDTLRDAEKIRIGGTNNIRGYSDNQFAFSGISYIRNEFRYYISSNGSLYLFSDLGIGAQTSNFTASRDRTTLIGYGLGIRIMAQNNMISMEYARNYYDMGNLGRIHFSIQNSMFTKTPINIHPENSIK